MLKWITLAPLIGALINGFFGKRLGEKFVRYNAPFWIGVSFVLSILSFNNLLHQTPSADGVRRITEHWFTWLQIGKFQADFAYLLDPLSGIYILFVTGVGFLIHVYATGYMHGDPGYYRFFAYLNLFMFMMLTLVLADNLLLLFVGWEGVGLCSYLLIGFYIHWQVAGDAAKKAFIVNRIGDLSFMVGMFVIFTTFGTISFVAKGGAPSFLTKVAALPLEALAINPFLWGTATIVALLLFGGAVGKSAQIPLFVWLPDAMAGPTPVSALIHAATMVTAGVYLTARCSAVVVKSPTAMLVIALIGAATAIVAATIGLAQNDIKKVLAYSTVSQLGYMFLACGVGAFIAGIFHVVTHAFFKALLFLGAGSVIHGAHNEQDMRRMGGFQKYMPKTYWTMFAAWLAICGIVPFAGFFSKDEILWKTFSTAALPGGLGKVLWGVAALTALLTAVYMTRMMAMTFWGDERSGNDHSAHGHGHDEHHEAHGTPHESPPVMWVPLAVLAVLSTIGGLIGVPAALGGSNHFEHFLAPAIAHVQTHSSKVASGPARIEVMEAAQATTTPTVQTEEHHNVGLEWGLMGLSLALAIVGIIIGRAIFLKNPLKPMPTVLENKWYMDELYDATVVNPIEKTSRSFLWKIVDVKLIDGFVNGVASTFAGLAGILRTTQTGLARSYAAVILLGAVIVIGYFASTLLR